jgi:tRNA G18 (ribose-2'-O)-methylase SpoU
MSYFEIGIFHTKTEHNIGTLWRSAYQLGASGIFTIGKRYSRMASDTMKTWKKIPLRHYDDFEDFSNHRPFDAYLIGVEFGGHPLKNFVHPKSCIYLLGAEDEGLPPKVIEKCNMVISIESITQPSYNVAVAGSIVMYHRLISGR